MKLFLVNTFWPLAKHSYVSAQCRVLCTGNSLENGYCRDGAQLSARGVVLPYMGYIGMCRCEGFGFQAVYSRIGGIWGVYSSIG